MTSRRKENWPSLLAAFIDERRGEAFKWGRMDCCLFACDGILTMTGIDPAAGDFRSRYDSALAATRLLRDHGGVEAIAEKKCAENGFEEWSSVAFARRGDVVLFDTSAAGPALGLCLGMHSAFPGTNELNLVPTANCRRAWRID